MKTSFHFRFKITLFAAFVITSIATVPVHALTVTCSTNKTIECWRPLTFDPPSATNGCCTNITVGVITNYSSVTTCSSTYTRYWLVSDCCTNYTCSQTVTLADTDPPAVACVSNKTVQCNSPWQFDQPSAYDTCCGTNLNYWLLSSNLVSSSTCQQVWRGLWQVSDCCSNYSAICTQLVTVADTTPPVIISCASNKTIQCGSPLTFDPPTAMDNCCPANSLTPELVNSFLVFSDPCRKVYAGRWRVRDCCTNYSLICTQYVEVVDTIVPIFTVLPSNMVFNCTCAGGNNVGFTVSAVDNCDTNIAVICTPPSGSFFPVGLNPVNCIARDACGNQTNYFFTITVLSNCPVSNCLTFQCPENQRLPCERIDGTAVTWTVIASNSCSPGSVVTWSDPPSGTPFDLGTHLVTCYASNTVQCEVKTCKFTVEIFPRGPRLSARRGGGTFGNLLMDYAQSCGEFAIEWRPDLGSGGSGGGSEWSPISGLPTGSWNQPNQTNNYIDHIIGFVVPDPGDPSPYARFFRLSSEVKRGRDFSLEAIGPLTNAAIPSAPWITFHSVGVPGQMQIVDIPGTNSTHALLVDDVGIIATFATNNSTWPNRLYDPPTFHEGELYVVGYINGPSNLCWFAEAFDTAGQLVDAIMDTNSPSMVTLRSRGLPLHHIKLWTEPNEPAGLVALKGRTDYTPAMIQFGDCLDFTSFPTGMVANPWILPGHTITSTNSAGVAEPSTYIESGPDGYGNGYHVNFSTTIHLTTNCCRHIQMELIKYAGPVHISAQDESGAELASHVVTQTGTPYTVDFPPTSRPICKLVVTSPDDQTRILRICCLPALPMIPPPTWCPGTNSNPLTVACNSNFTEPVTFQLIVGGQLSDLLHTYLFPHGGFTVFDLGNESLATIDPPCNKIVVEVFSENPNSGMELEAADELGFVISRYGPLEDSASLQTVVLTGPGIKTVRFKCPAAQGYLKAFYGLP